MLIDEFIAEETSLNYPTDDDKLQIFLRPCKYYPNSALTRVSTSNSKLTFAFDRAGNNGGPNYNVMLIACYIGKDTLISVERYTRLIIIK